MKIKRRTTHRGFVLLEFTDINGVECSVQKSSLATDDAVWIGAQKIGVHEFTPGLGWREVDLKKELGGDSYIANNSMHLNRKQVQKLLPILVKFVETGEL
jgi:hypothetical protein